MTADIDREKLRELCERATPGAWRWWTSCSWRRLSSDARGNDRNGKPLDRDGGVICPYVCRDGHPDLIITEEDADFIAASRTAIPALLDLTDAQAAKIAELEAGNWQKTRALEAENERLGRLVYVPGIWRCAKCNFRLAQSNLNIGDGTMTARDDAGDTCPNCNSLLWRVSERDERQEAIVTSNKLFDDLEQAKTLIATLESERDQLKAENASLRAALAMSDQPCAYCSLPSDDFAKCEHGFPGCSRADDALGCPHLGEALEAGELRSKIASLESERDQLRKQVEGQFVAGMRGAVNVIKGIVIWDGPDADAQENAFNEASSAILSAASALEQKEQG